MENGSNTPDFILAQYLVNCLLSFNSAVQCREKWYGREKLPLNQQPCGPLTIESNQPIAKELNTVLKELVQEVCSLKLQMKIMRENHPFTAEDIATLNKCGIE